MFKDYNFIYKLLQSAKAGVNSSLEQSKFGHDFLLVLLSRKLFLLCGGAGLVSSNLALWHWHLSALAQVAELLKELFAAARKQVEVVEALLSELLGVLRALTLIKHVDHNQLVGLVFEPEKLGDHFVPRNVGSREVDRLFDPPQIVLVGIAHVKEEKGGLCRNSNHLSCVGHCGRLRNAGAHRDRGLVVLGLFNGILRAQHLVLARHNRDGIKAVALAQLVDGLLCSRVLHKQAGKGAALNTLELLGSALRN